MYMKRDVLILFITLRGLCRASGTPATSLLWSSQPSSSSFTATVKWRKTVEEVAAQFDGAHLEWRLEIHMPLTPTSCTTAELWGSCRFHRIKPAHTSTMSVIRVRFILISMLIYLLPSLPGRYGPESVMHHKA